MSRKTIKKISTVATIVLMIVTAYTFTAFAAPALDRDAEETISKALQSIGVEDGTIPGFYIFALDQIADGLATMDEAMTAATGSMHDISGVFDQAVTDTFTEFAGVSEEEAFDKLNEILNDIK